ncbi:MAG: hypothetical protein SynsKO_13140 [Synoicihabitans sp.]
MMFRFLSLMLLSLGGGAVAWAQETIEMTDSTTEVLVSARQIRALSRDRADQRLPVRLQGVVLQGVRPRPGAIILWDGSEEIYIEGREAFAATVKPGVVLEIQGRTSAGGFAPVVLATTAKILGEAELPPPLVTTVSEVAAGGFDATWVELEAIVQSYSPLGGGDGTEGRNPIWVLEIKQGDSGIQVRLEADLDVSSLLDTRVRFRGICYSVHNPNRQFVRATMVVTGEEFIEVVSRPPSPEELPITSANELLAFSQSGYSGHRVKVRGVVTHHEPGRALWIRDGERGLEVLTAQKTPAVPGEFVEILGFPEHGHYAPRLIDATFRLLEQREPPSPHVIELADDTIANEANLIQLEGELLDFQTSAEGYRLSMGWRGGSFQGFLRRQQGRDVAPLEFNRGARLRVSGISTRVPQAWTPQIGTWEIEEFQILLRSPEDITVLDPGPWLTEERGIYILSISAGLLLIVIIGVVISARRAIARRGVDRKMAEAEFAAMLKERNRVARDIHDTLAQGLNAVSMQLELAKNTSGVDRNKSELHLNMAHKIVRGCIREARESIWNMRSHILDQTDLPGALEKVLNQLSTSRSIEPSVSIEGRRRRLAPQLENDLLRVGQEAIANALKHARATVLEVRILFKTGGVVLTVTDDGCGFDPSVSPSAGTHFGLKGIRERVEQMGGTIEFRSGNKGGTVVTVEVGEAGRVKS